MLGKLIALSKNGEEKESLPVVNLHFFIGSDLFCDLRINHKDIAAQHCLITSQKNKPALIRNLSRTVPTLVNNTEIGSSDVELKDNDIIAIRHKNYKWCYDSSSSPSTSSQASYVVTSKNRKSWPLFKNKLVAVVTPQRRDEDVQMTENIQLGILQNEVLPKKRRGTIAEENISKSKSAPKVLAIKSGLRATNMPKFGKQKLSMKNGQNIVPMEGTPKVLLPLNRKSVKFLDTSAPRSRLGMRGRKSSLAVPYKGTPAKQKVSVYVTPPSSFKRDKKKPIKSILKTPSSLTTPRKDEHDERLFRSSGIVTTPLSNVPENSRHSALLSENDLLQTPVMENQPEIVMRSSKRKAAAVRSPPSTPKSITKRKKSPEEKSIEASERAAKKLKKGPPHAIDKKKRAALLQCHRKSLTPHPVARRSGKFITNFPSSFSSRLETISPARSKFLSKFNNSRKSENLNFSIDSLAPNVFKYSSLDKQIDSETILPNTTSQEKVKPGSRKNSLKSFSKTSPFIRKFTRASRAACISNNSPQKKEATDVLSALHLSRKWPSPIQGEVCGNGSQDVSNLSGFKKLFSVDKTLDVRELFLEKNSESDTATEKSFQSLPETHMGRVSRNSALLKGKQSTDKEELMYSFQSEGAQDLPCSDSLLSGSLSSFPSYSSTSRRSLSLKRGRKSTVSPKDTNSSLLDQRTEEQQTPGKKTIQSNDNVMINSLSSSRKARRSLSTLNGSSLENNHLTQLSNLSSNKLLNISNEISKNSIDPSHCSSPMNATFSRSNFGDCKVSQKSINDSSSDVSVFSLGSFNSSYHKNISGDSLSLSQFISDDKETFLEDSGESEVSGINKNVRLITPVSGKINSKGRISLRRAVLLASTPKQGKLLRNNGSHSSLDVEVDTKETSFHESGSSKLQLNRSHNLSPDITSGKLKKVLKKGKGFIARTSARCASLPLTTDSSILKDLSAISTSVGHFKTSLCNKVNRNGSQLDLLKSSENLINNNMDSSVTTLSSFQSASQYQSEITDHSDIEVLPKQVLTPHISDSPRRSRRKTPSNISTLSSTNNSIEKRGRISKLSVGPDNSRSTTLKKHSRSLPSLPDYTDDEQTTPKQSLSISESFLQLRRSSRKRDSKIFSKADKDPSFSTPSTLAIKSYSDKKVDDSPLIKGSFNTSIARRSRPPKLSVSLDNDQLEKSTTVKKRSRSLPFSSEGHISPKQASSILDESVHLRRSSRKGDSKVLNVTHINTSSSSLTVSDKDGAAPVIKTSPNDSVGRRGRPSKLSVDPENTQLEKSTTLKKRSRSLPFSSDDHTTPKQASRIPDESVHLRRSSRKGDSKVLNVTDINTSSSSLTVSDKDGAAPVIKTSPNDSVGRRGRPSKLSVDPENTQLEKSTTLKKRSRSLPFSSDDHTTPKQVSSILDESVHLRRSSRKGDSKVSNMTHINISSSSLTMSDKGDGTTAIIKTSPKDSVGRKGRPSKLSVDPENTQLEKSTTLKKRSRSLPFSSDDHITPKQASSILDESVHLRRSSRKGDSKVLNVTDINTSSSSLTVSDKDGAAPVIKTSPNDSVGRRGRPSKLSVDPENTQLEKSTTLKKRSRSLPFSSDDHITPKQASSILDESVHLRRSSRKGDSKVLNVTDINTSSSSLTVSDKDGAAPVIKTFPNDSVGRSGRPSKLSVDPENTQLEKSTTLKKRSRSLPFSSDDHTTPKLASSILDESVHLRRSSRKGDSKVLNVTDINTSSSSLIVSDKDGAAPVIKTSPNDSVGRRWRPSKLSVDPENTQLEKSTTLKKRSRSLPFSSDDHITPKQASSILDESVHLRRSSRKGDSKVLNVTDINTSSSSLTVSDKDGAAPVIKTSPNDSVGRRGRPSKLSVDPENTQLEKSTTLKKRSRSLPFLSDDHTTPKQASSILDESVHLRRSSRKGDSKVSNMTHINISSSSLTMSDKGDGTTAIIKTSPKDSVGRKGRPSKLSVHPDDSQLEKSPIVKKNSQSLLSLSGDSCLRRSSRKGDDSKRLIETLIDTSSSSRIVLDRTHSDEEIYATPNISTLSSVKTSMGTCRKPSKHSVSPYDSNKKSTILKKISQNLPSSSDHQITPKDTPTNLDNSGCLRENSRKEYNGKIINKISFSSLSSEDKTDSVLELVDTPKINSLSSINTSIGRRGRSSKYSVGCDTSQPTAFKKRSRSLPSSTEDQTKPASSIPENILYLRRSSRKANESTSSSSASKLSDKTPSNKEFSARSKFNASSAEDSSEKRRKPSKVNDSPLKESIIEKKPSQSIISYTENKDTPKQALRFSQIILQPRKSSRKVNDCSIKTEIQENVSSRKSNFPNDFTSDMKTDDDTPNVSSVSTNTSVGRRGRPSKLEPFPDNSQSEKSTFGKKRSRSLPSSSDDSLRPRRSSKIGDDGKKLKKIHIDTSSSSQIDKTPSDEEVYATPNISILSLSVKTSVGKHNRSSEHVVDPDNVQLKKSNSLEMEKGSRSLPSSSDDHNTPKQVSSILNNAGHSRRSSRKDDKIVNPDESQLKKSTILKKSSPNLSEGQNASKLVFNIHEDSLHRRRSTRKVFSSFDHTENIGQCEFEKSNKRKIEEIYPESCLKNSISFCGSSEDKISFQSKKKVKISNSDCLPIFSDNNKRSNYLETMVGNSKTFGAFSSTPIVTNGGKNRSRSKFKNIQSPIGLSPIIGSNEGDSSVNDESSQISMICLRHLKCSSDVGERSKSKLFVESSKMQSNEENRSHNNVELNVKSSSNCGTINSNVKLSKKSIVNLSASQNELPIVNQTPVTSQFTAIKEDKSLRLMPQIRKSEYSKRSLQESIKEKMNNITFGLRSKTPVIKLSPGKSLSRSRKTCKDMDSIKEKNLRTVIHETSLVEEIIAPPKLASDNSLSKRETENREASLRNELSSNLNRLSFDNKSVEKSSSKISEQNGLSVKSPVPQRRGRPPKVKNISETKKSINKILPVSQRRGRSAKNIDLSSPLESTEAPIQKFSRKKKGRKTIIAEDSSSSKKHDVNNVDKTSDQTKLEKVERNSPVSFPKTRSKVAVLALRTPSKSVISSPIVKPTSSKRRRVGKIKSENTLTAPQSQKRRQLPKEFRVGAASDDECVLLDQISANEKIKGKKSKIQNSSPVKKNINIEEKNINLSSPVKRRGRSAVKNALSGKEKQVPTVSKKDLIGTSPPLPKRGRPIKVQDNDNNISNKGKVLNEIIEEPSTLSSQKRGRSIIKKSDSSPNKRGKSEKDTVNNNDMTTFLSLPKKGRTAKVQDTNLSVSGKKTSRKASESENTSLRRGRSVVKNSDPTNNRDNRKEDPINKNETIPSPSQCPTRRGRPAKVQDSNKTVYVKKTARMTSPSAEGENTSLRRGRSVVKNSDSSNKRAKSKTNPANNNETISSQSLPKKGRTANKVQDRAVTDSRRKSNKKDSEIEEVQTTMRRRGRSIVKDKDTVLGTKKTLISSQSEINVDFSMDFTLPKRGRTAKGRARNTSESADGQNTLPLLKRESPLVKNSDSSPVKRGKSKKDPTDNNVITSPSFTKRGRSARTQAVVTATVKGKSDKVLTITDDQNYSSSLRRGRSAAVEEHPPVRKGKLKQDIGKNSIAQISSSEKRGRPAVLENVSSVASKEISPLLVKKKQATTENILKLPGRRGNLDSSPLPEIRKVSDRSKAIKKNSKIKDNRPLKSAIKKNLSKRLSRKSSLVGLIKHGRRKVHFNKNVVRNSNSKKK